MDMLYVYSVMYIILDTIRVHGSYLNKVSLNLKNYCYNPLRPPLTDYPVIQT